MIEHVDTYALHRGKTCSSMEKIDNEHLSARYLSYP